MNLFFGMSDFDALFHATVWSVWLLITSFYCSYFLSPMVDNSRSNSTICITCTWFYKIQCDVILVKQKLDRILAKLQKPTETAGLEQLETVETVGQLHDLERSLAAKENRKTLVCSLLTCIFIKNNYFLPSVSACHW